MTVDEELLLDALESDQLSEAKAPYGRRRLDTGTTALMWGLRAYALLALLVVVVRVVQVAGGG